MAVIYLYKNKYWSKCVSRPVFGFQINEGLSGWLGVSYSNFVYHLNVS